MRWTYITRKKSFCENMKSDTQTRRDRICDRTRVATDPGRLSLNDALQQRSLNRPLPKAITVDHSMEFTSKSLDEWTWNSGVKLDFIRPGKRTENAFIESFKRPATRRPDQPQPGRNYTCRTV